MWLLVRMVFWLSVAIALLPVTSSQQETSASQVWAIDALSAASAAVSDIRQFCVRQPGACAAGSQAIVQFGHKAETGAKWLYQFLNERKATDQLPVTMKGADKSSTGRPSASTLTPTDLLHPGMGRSRARKPNLGDLAEVLSGHGLGRAGGPSNQV
jgi:Family of unknown function (DUF5330)